MEGSFGAIRFPFLDARVFLTESPRRYRVVPLGWFSGLAGVLGRDSDPSHGPGAGARGPGRDGTGV